MGITIILTVFFVCFFILRKKKLYNQLELEYGNIKNYSPK